MTSITKALSIRILRFVDERFPGMVECDFTDAEGRHHTVVEKTMVVTTDIIEAESSYPRAGYITCQILEERHDSSGRCLLCISTKPDGIESLEGLSEFIVLCEQIVELDSMGNVIHS